MKRALLICATLIVAYSCIKPDNNENPSPTPSADSITIPSSENTSPIFATEGGTASVAFTASGVWTASVINTRADGWCTVSPTSGAPGSGSITVKASANDTNDERSATILIKCGTAEKSISATQKQKDALTVTKSRFDIGSNGGDVQIEVKSNISFEYRIEDDAKSWVFEEGTKAMSTKTLNFKVAENEENEKREGTITIFSGNLSEQIKIYQEGAKPTIVLSQSEYAVKAEGETIQVEVSSNVNVRATIKSGANWVSEVSTKAMSTNTFYYAVATNESYDSRVAEIEFANTENGLSEKVTITQVQKDAIVIAKNLYEFGRDGGTLSIEVNHSVEFEIEISDEWISEISTKGMTSTSKQFTIDKNDSRKEREGHIIFKSKDGSISQQITIKQSLVTVIVTSSKSLTFESVGGSAVVEINQIVNFDYDIFYPDNTDDDKLGWISLSSIPEPRINLTIQENTSYERRRALLVVKDVDSELLDTVKIFVKQKELLETDKDLYTVSYDGGTIIVPFSSSYDYSVRIPEDATWLSLIQTKAVQSHEISLSVQKNATESEREAKVLISLTDGSLSKEITIRQYSDTYVGDVDASDYYIKLLREAKIRRIKGNLYASGSMSDLDNMIEEIDGDVIVSGISNFDGLYGLKRINGDLTIKFYSNNTILLSLEGLNNLEEIGGDFSCSYWYSSSTDKEKKSGFADSDFSKLHKLKSIGGDLRISLFKYNTGALTSLKGLDNLKLIGGGIRTKYLPSLNGLGGVEHVKSLYVENAYSLEGLEGISMIEGDLSLINGEYDSFVGLKNLTYVGGNMLIKASIDANIGTSTVKEFSKITSLSGFDSLREIAGDLEINSYVDASYGKGSGLNNLANLSGLNSLQRIGGSLKIIAKGQGNGSSAGAGHYSHAYCLNNLKSIDISSLQEIGGDILVDNFDSNDGDGEYYSLIELSDFSFSSLKTIGGDITYHYITHKGSGSYREKEGYGIIKKAPAKLQNVHKINAVCSFKNESDGFLALESIEDLTGNGIGFPKLKRITGKFEITTGVSQIGAMPCLESITNELKINNTNVTRIQSFNKLVSVGTVVISGNSQLATIDGFSSLTSCSSISISGSPSLVDFGSFVNAVKNGSSWSASGCGYNPTKYQMMNGQSKP